MTSALFFPFSYLLGIRMLPMNKASRIKIGTYKVKLSFGVLRSNAISTRMVEKVILSANRSFTSMCSTV